MRSEPSVLHLDLDAFFAAVEQRDKPSLRGRPVVVGGIGPRGVVSTASYEARAFGIRSAMRTGEARARCSHAAYLAPRFTAYRQASRAVMAILRRYSPLVEPLSVDEAYVDLAVGARPASSAEDVRRLAQRIKAEVTEATGGLTASVGAGTSKLIAKVASDLDKPDGLVVVEPGTERALLDPMSVRAIPGIGPATTERLRRAGVRTVGELAAVEERELVGMLGRALGTGLARLARAEDERSVEAYRESKSVSVEDTFERDISEPAHLDLLVTRIARQTAERLGHAHLSGRTVTVKVRLYDFSTHTRSATLPGPTDDERVITRMARRLLGEVDTSVGVRLLGVGVSGLADWVQTDLFADLAPGEPNDRARAEVAVVPGASAVPEAAAVPETAEVTETTEAVEAGSVPEPEPAPAPGPEPAGDDLPDAGANAGAGQQRGIGFAPGSDVVHQAYGQGWVWGAGLGRVTIRFESRGTGPGPVRTLRTDDPELAAFTPYDPHAAAIAVEPRQADVDNHRADG